MKRLPAPGFFRSCVLAGCLISASLLGMREAKAGEPVPMLTLSDDLPPPAARARTLLMGAAVFGGFYGGALAASYGWDEDPGAADLRIPLVGPWLKVGHTTLCANLPESNTPCSDPAQVAGGVLAVISGIGQIGGLALLLEGTFMRTRAKNQTALHLWQPRGRASSPSDDWQAGRGRRLQFVPILTPSTFGAVMTGSF